MTFSVATIVVNFRTFGQPGTRGRPRANLARSGAGTAICIALGIAGCSIRIMTFKFGVS